MTPDEKTEIALSYLARGWNVIPVGNNKIPSIPWKKYQQEMSTEEDIRAWFANPDLQIGIVTGRVSNLTVIDVEKEGDPEPFNIWDTYSIKTGGGGFHFYFSYEPDIANAVRVLPNVDVRSEGGYVVAAGSTSTKGDYEVIEELEVQRMPIKLHGIFVKKPEVLAPPTETTQPTGSMPTYEGSGEGSRNDALTRYTGAVLAKMHPSLWLSIALPIILEANKKNTPPLPEFEVKLIFKSISEREMPRTTERLYGESRLSPTSSSDSDEAASKENPSIITLEQAASEQVIDVDNTTATNIGIFDEALMGGFSPGDLIIIAGRSGVGKTTFAQDLTASFLSAEHGALWFSYEVMAVPLFRKFQEMELSEAEYGRLFVPRPPLTSTLEEIIAICKKAKEEHGVRLVVIDHAGFIDPDMNHGNHALAVTQIVRALKQMAVNNELIVILPVHVRKVENAEPSLEDVRDSYGVVQESDVVFLIDRKRATTAAEKESSYYSNMVRIQLAKNRKTGVSKSGTFSLVANRYAYQEALSLQDEAYQDTPKSYSKKSQNKEADAEWERITADMD